MPGEGGVVKVCAEEMVEGVVAVVGAWFSRAVRGADEVEDSVAVVVEAVVG